MTIVRELESQGGSALALQRKYGIHGDGTITRWLAQYGNGSRGKVMRVETPQEINQLKQLRDRVRRLESALADASLELALERAYVQLACERAGITDVEAFRKKTPGPSRTRPTPRASRPPTARQ
jgi:transposase-like protein